jgi:chorismate-pyruvate lyase
MDATSPAVQIPLMKTISPWLVALACLAPIGRVAEAQVGPANGGASTAEVLRQFEAELDGADSATQVLTRWCGEHGMADPPVIMAVRVRDVDKPADAAIRRLLDAGPDEPLRYRRVRLTCGTHVLSEADNWYRPGLLTPEMNQRLDSGDTPFGAVVRPLKFHRRTLAIQRLLRSRDVVRVEGGRERLPHALLRHRALLLNPQGEPFSVVVETYTSEIMAFGPRTGAPVSR